MFIIMTILVAASLLIHCWSNFSAHSWRNNMVCFLKRPFVTAWIQESLKKTKLSPLRKKKRCDFLQLIPTVRSHREEQKVGGPKVEVTHSALKMACGSWESHHVPPSPVRVAHGVSFTSSWASIGQPHKCCWVTSSWKRRNFKTYTTPWLCPLERGSSHVSALLRFDGGRWETFRRRKTSLLCCWNKKLD